jgi:hypothetical protein
MARKIKKGKKITKKPAKKILKPDALACPYEGSGVPLGTRCYCLSCRGADM